MSRHKTTLFVAWAVFVVVALWLFFSQRAMLAIWALGLVHLSLAWRYAIYLVLGCIRGFTFIPVTYLIILGLIFLKPTPAYILTLIGVMVSSSVIYYSARYFKFSAVFEKTYPKQIARLKGVLKKGELPIVITWAFLPITPTDVVCYVCGALKIDVRKMWLGVLIGEGISCAMYIYIGKGLLLFILHRFMGG